MFFDLMTEVKHETEHPLMENPWNSFELPKQSDIKKNDNTKQKKNSSKRVKKEKDNTVNQPIDDSKLEELRRSFNSVQMQHPESRLELQCVDGAWKVWCGACKKLLRPDKSGKALHNIQKQHFSTFVHKKRLHQMLQAEEEEAAKRRNSVSI